MFDLCMSRWYRVIRVRATQKNAADVLATAIHSAEGDVQLGNCVIGLEHLNRDTRRFEKVFSYSHKSMIMTRKVTKYSNHANYAFVSNAREERPPVLAVFASL